MVTPVTSSTVYINRPVKIGTFDTWSYLSTRLLQKQAKPIDRVLPYTRRLSEIIRYSYAGIFVGGADTIQHCDDPDWTTCKNDVINRSYSKLRDKINTADMGVNLVEYRQASAMFGKRGTDVLNVAYLLARRRFAEAGRVLNCSFYDGKPPRRNRQKWVLPDYPKKTNISLSNLWLEWHFGWSPLISDCQAAAKVLTDPIPNVKISGSAETFGRTYRRETMAGTPGWFRTHTIVTRFRHRQGAYVGITNPNLGLAGQLGLLNPAALAWEIVPFSFVADWFVNVGDWLQGFTDFAGMTLVMPYSTLHMWTFFTKYEYTPPGVPPSTVPSASGELYGKKLEMVRKVGLTTPILSTRPLKLPSLSRAATVWSLASQILQRR